jgi:uncharacterized protein YjbK
VEIEFKNMVGKHDFERLLNVFQIPEADFIKQVNHYFDTNAFLLKKQNAALRVRHAENEYELTLKRKQKTGLLEISQKITADDADAMLKQGFFPEGEVKEELLAMKINPTLLSCFGSLETRRAQQPFEPGCLMFDHSLYMGKEDFEVEFEVPEDRMAEGKSVFFRLLKELHIPPNKADSKIKRLFDAKYACWE